MLDRNAMRLTRGGAIDGRIATHFIDPGFGSQGFTQAGGYSFNPFPSAGFRGNVAKAKQLLRQAGYANGMYSGPQLTMVADNTPPGSNTAQVVAAAMAKIGFNVKTISVTHSTMYTRFCNVPKSEPNVCPNVGWLPDFHDPQTILDVTFNGKRITTGQQLQLAAPERPEAQRRDGAGGATARPARAGRSVGEDRPGRHEDRGRGSLALGELSDAVLPPRHGGP